MKLALGEERAIHALHVATLSGPGRDLVLLAAQQFGRKTLRELAREAEVEYGTVSNALYRIRKRMESDLKLQREWNDYCKCINRET